MNSPDVATKIAERLDKIGWMLSIDIPELFRKEALGIIQEELAPYEELVKAAQIAVSICPYGHHRLRDALDALKGEQKSVE